MTTIQVIFDKINPKDTHAVFDGVRVDGPVILRTRHINMDEPDTMDELLEEHPFGGFSTYGVVVTKKILIEPKPINYRSLGYDSPPDWRHVRSEWVINRDSGDTVHVDTPVIVEYESTTTWTWNL